MAAFVARGNALGEPMSVQEARENLFGFALMNDWSGGFALLVSAWDEDQGD
jgi:fumarylacetoacetase